jgi:hypothetical protein
MHKNSLPGWARRPEILDYVIECYAGTEKVEGGRARRVYLWEDGPDIKMGNTEAFAQHLCKRFDLLRVHTSDLHNLLRQMGEVIQKHRPHAPPGASRGWVPPEPEEWVVGQTAKEAEPE